MVFVKVISAKDLQPGNLAGVEADGKEILVVNLDGKYFAIGNRCTHMSCLLSDGSLRRENVTCPCHASVFDVKTGNVIKGPAKKPELVFAVKVEGEQVSVEV